MALRQKFKLEKSINAILYILEKLGGETDRHKLSKIFYFADRKHLSKFGRSISGDFYIAMDNGPVPSHIYDLLKAQAETNQYSDKSERLKSFFIIYPPHFIKMVTKPDLRYMSASDLEALDYAIELCRMKDFNELTELSHGPAWQKTLKNGEIDVKDILLEDNNESEYINYVMEGIKIQDAVIKGKLKLML